MRNKYLSRKKGDEGMYSMKFRKEVLKVASEEGQGLRKVALMFGIGTDTVSRWKRRLEPKKVCGTKRKIDLEKLKEDVEKNPDSYQYERAERFKVSQNAISCALKKLNISYKKSLVHVKRDQSQRQDFLEKLSKYEKAEYEVVV